jgi:hypothetical protein
MNKLLSSFLILLGLLIFPAIAQKRTFGNIKLLEGYKYKQEPGTDALIGIIAKDGGLTIEFESGLQQGYAADLKKKHKYIWYQEQIVNGHKVVLALTKSGVGTVWKPEKSRSLRDPKVLIITFPGRFGPNDATNFWAEVLNDQEIAEMILMALTFNPSKE